MDKTNYICTRCGRSFTPIVHHQRQCSLACAIVSGISHEEFDAFLAAKQKGNIPPPHLFHTSDIPQPDGPHIPVSSPKPEERLLAQSGSIMDELPGGEFARKHRLLQTTQYNGDITRDSHAYAVAGRRYDQLASQLLRSGQTIVLTGYGCGIRVEHDALVVDRGSHIPSPTANRPYPPPWTSTASRVLSALTPSAHSHSPPLSGVETRKSR